MSSLIEPKKLLHIALFPWLALGHIIPFLKVAKHIARTGHKVSFISTPRNIQRLPKIPPDLIPSITLVQIPLPIFDFLQTHSPDWIIHDYTPHWLHTIASNLGIRRAHLSLFNAFSVCFFGPTVPDHFTVPPEWVPFPSKLYYRPFEAKKMFGRKQENASGITDWDRMASTIQEIEGDWLDLLPELHGRPVIPLGLLPPIDFVQSSEEKEDSNWPLICEWLDNQEKQNVVYIALGSGVNLSQQDFTERPGWSKDADSVKLPERFEDQAKGPGIVWTTWAPQHKILAHKATGGFLTHSALIMLPFLYDQGLNARFGDKKIGIEVPRNEDDGSFIKDWVAESLNLVVVDEEGKRPHCCYQDMNKECSALCVENLEKHLQT
ncbi:UDP-rhamnose:rhamnosyltransferase 1 [Pyrus ussuriensis x Pyrus communis]|uniref:UDP-rhamnose:rhamnosyltransferase 1 n=1 Tax=Pyrus ussuriensis x Pyrus communis TaxID=2448454 RepID=A0A5N5F394_9ROSA|nr:UDP-rhamnose:rhamnosyltransferase 1 [Pyrus ussuriensis x Pyrus communis]